MQWWKEKRQKNKQTTIYKRSHRKLYDGVIKKKRTFDNKTGNTSYVAEYLCPKWPRVCSVCRKHNPVHSSFIYIVEINKKQQKKYIFWNCWNAMYPLRLLLNIYNIFRRYILYIVKKLVNIQSNSQQNVGSPTNMTIHFNNIFLLLFRNKIWIYMDSICRDKDVLNKTYSDLRL
jgi:hypothetical protein